MKQPLLIGYLCFMIAVLVAGSGFSVWAYQPLTSIKTFYVDDYGAVADGKTNSEAGISAAIAAAKDFGKPSIVEFSRGVYRIDKALASPRNTQKDFAVIVEGMTDLTLRGSASQGTTILIANPSLGGIRVQNSSNISIENMIFDYEITPFTQGTVVSADEASGEIVLDLDIGYPQFDHPCFHPGVYDGTWGGPVKKDPNPLLSEYGAYAMYSRGFERVADRRWKIKIADNSLWTMGQAGIKPGSRYVQVANLFANAPITAWSSSSINVSDVTIYAAPSVCIFLALCDRVSIERYTVTVKPGSDRMISGNADGVHAASVRGGIHIADSYFEGMMDNGIDIHTRPGWVYDQYSDKKIRINRGVNEYRIGDLLHFFDGKSNHLKGIATITKVTEDSPHLTVVELDKELPNLQASATASESDRVYNASACGQGSVIENNTFFNHRGRSMLVTTHDMLIQNNQFNLTHNSDVALFMEISPEWGGGLGSYDITIKGNVFTGVGKPRVNTAIAANTGDAKDGVHTRIIHSLLIEGNRFENIFHQAVRLNGVENVLIKDNEIHIAPERIRGSAIVLQNARGVVIDGLAGTDPNTSSLTTSLIFAENTVVAGDKGVRIKNIDYTFTSGSEAPLILSLAHAPDQRNRFIAEYVHYPPETKDPENSEITESLSASTFASSGSLPDSSLRESEQSSESAYGSQSSSAGSSILGDKSNEDSSSHFIGVSDSAAVSDSVSTPRSGNPSASPTAFLLIGLAGVTLAGTGVLFIMKARVKQK